MSDARSWVLARRARFLVAAVAVGAGVGCGSAGPCLSPPAFVRDTAIDGPVDTGDTGPSVCLSAPPPDASDADTSDTSDSTPDSDGATG